MRTILWRRTALLALALTALIAAPLRAPAAPDALELTILHTNDLHGRLLPFEDTARAQAGDGGALVGGLARRATMVRAIRRTAGHPVLLLDAGDISTRGPLWTANLGAPEIDAMNAMAYDAASLGNNEFKLKAGVDEADWAGAQAALTTMVRRSQFLWVCANATTEHGEQLPGVRPYVVTDRGGVRVGILSVITPRCGEYPQTRGLRFADPIKAAKEWVPKVRAECDVLIALTHVGVTTDRALAAAVPGIDVIVGGDSHTFLREVLRVRNPEGAEVPIVQAGQLGVCLGRLDLGLTRDEKGAWHATVRKYALLPVGPDTPADPDVAAVLAPYVRPYERVVGRWPALGGAPAECARQTRLLFAEALRRSARTELAFVTNAGFQGALRRPVITRYELCSAWSFHDHVVIVSMTGAEIAAMRTAQPDGAMAGAPAVLDPARSYRVAMIDYFALDGMKLPAARVKDTRVDVRDAVTAFLAPSARKAGTGAAKPGQPHRKSERTTP